MRDFRDAKVMAHTLRATLATKGLKITVSQSLELIAQAFGVADWNTLSATIRGEAAGPRNNAHSPQFPTTATMHLALAYAIQRKHQYETLEHLLLALIDDVDASAVMKACKVDLGALKEKLTNYIDNDLKTMVIDDGGEPKQSAGFQRVVQRAAHYAEGRGRPTRTGAELLVAIFAETEYRSTEGDEGCIPALATEPVGLNVNVIVTYATGVPAAQRATATIPIVMAA
jgi:hypothetical protein